MYTNEERIRKSKLQSAIIRMLLFGFYDSFFFFFFRFAKKQKQKKRRNKKKQQQSTLSYRYKCICVIWTYWCRPQCWSQMVLKPPFHYPFIGNSYHHINANLCTTCRVTSDVTSDVSSNITTLKTEPGNHYAFFYFPNYTSPHRSKDSP